jgi:hypothetical protein
MDKVCGNSYCKIAATYHPTGRVLSTPSEIYEPATISLNFSCQNGVDYKDNFTVIDSNIWAANITRYLLMKCARVFQERILAPRVPHFSKSQLFWECCSLQACENYLSGLPSLSQTQLDRKFRPVTRTVLYKRLQNEPLEYAVEHY